jgi:hypothetical protein
VCPPVLENSIIHGGNSDNKGEAGCSKWDVKTKFREYYLTFGGGAGDGGAGFFIICMDELFNPF